MQPLLEDRILDPDRKELLVLRNGCQAFFCVLPPRRLELLQFAIQAADSRFFGLSAEFFSQGQKLLRLFDELLVDLHPLIQLLP